MNLKILSFIFISLSIFATSINSHGQVGYINIPSAYSLKESTINFMINRNEPDRKISLTASPFSWLDANIFYVDITGKPYGGGFKQSNKDKGFSFKANLGKIYGHQFAIGINDIAGTGYFSSEYLVLSKRYEKFEYSVGMGWGNYSSGLSINNPLKYISEDFKTRSITTKDEGGSPDYKNYFSGKKASLFFGGAYILDNNNKIFIEYDPTSLDRIEYPHKNTRLNIGHQIKFGNTYLKTSIKRGSIFNIQFDHKLNFLSYKSNANPVEKKDISNFSELQKQLEENNIGLKDVYEDDSSIEVSVRQNIYQNQFEPNEIIRKSLTNLTKNKKEIIISQFSQGMKVSEISYSTNQKKNIRNENYVDYNRGDNVYKVIDKFPYINNSISPVLRNFIASREKFYFGSILLENDTEIIFTERLQILANLKYSLYDNFQGLYLPPVDTYPNQVRSDLKKYLNNLNRGISIGRLEANYFFSFGKKNFFRLSAGIFEEMFGGYGFDYIFYPEGSNISLGLETFYVKKREYTLDLKFKDYSNYITRASIELSEPRTDINFKLSAGEYLAGDKGYTFEVSRRFENGVKFGAFFSRTDVSAAEYGEGSFDKGIKLVIPFSIFGKGDSLTRYEWHPLTKDPAALLIKSTDLRTEVQRYRIY